MVAKHNQIDLRGSKYFTLTVKVSSESPISDEEVAVPISSKYKVDELASKSAKWASSIILYVVGDTPTLKYINTFIEKNWNCVSQPEVLLHNDGYFVIRFGTIKEMKEVLYSRPYTIAYKPMIMKAWTSDFNFNAEILKVVPLWIQLPNLPLNCWGMDSLSRIGSALGSPLFVNECNSKQTRISYARMLVEIDVTRPIVHKVMFQEPGGKKFEQSRPECGQEVTGQEKHVKQKRWVPKPNVPQATTKDRDSCVPVSDTGPVLPGPNGEKETGNVLKKSVVRAHEASCSILAGTLSPLLPYDALMLEFKGLQ
ncbi:uncharacterized protein [Spinacia oleracea]|uniref:DUF4283 domain-containing protein n=1 Tax=Spinacia oleracea TaxID=3562 RepID=A0ABM3QQU5_SPIOL|nr:uncharacterized protein LOC130461599 [Spinacia oleracea]